jgi:GNAT superfamily N-acetyltransferase
LSLTDDEVARGLRRHVYWPFYSPGLASAQTLLAVDGRDLLAAAQAGFVGHGWGYGAAAGDGPDWLYDVHLSLFWLFAWPGWPAAAEASALLAARIVAWARSQGLPGLEAFRGGPGFLPFGTQLSSRWPHLWSPVRSAGFRQPRDLLVYGGETAPDVLAAGGERANDLVFRTRRGRLEAWRSGEPVGTCLATALGESWASDCSFADPRAGQWAVIRRLVVAEAARGQGVGSALFAEQLRSLHGRGVTRYLLHIPDAPEERPGQALYAKFGALLDRQQVLRVSF